MQMKEVLERIDAIKERLGTTDRHLSLSAGLSGDALRNWRRRLKNGEDAGANHRSLEAVAQALGVSTRWLVEGEEEGLSETRRPLAALAAQKLADLCRIPLYDMGDPALPGTDALRNPSLGEIGFPPAILSSLTNSSTAKLVMLKVRGDSMLPSLSDGDLILVDTLHKNLNTGGLFVLLFGDTLRIKRVDRNPSTHLLRVKSDNAAYDPFDIAPHDLDVFGRIIWLGRRA